MLIAFILLLFLFVFCGGKGCVKGLLSIAFGAMLLMAGCAIL